MKKFIFLFFVILISSKEVKLQEKEDGELKITGNAEMYYNINNSDNQTESKYSGTSVYTDEFRINIASVSLKYNNNKVRGTVTLQYGDIPEYNWGANDKKFIQEANAGLMLTDNLWIDGGYFLTHIGAESIIPSKNFLTSLSLPAFFEPIYQSGLKLSYKHSDKFSSSVFLLNGYNQLDDNNKNKSFGIQLEYIPADNLKLYFNNLTGNEQPYGSVSKVRYYNNIIISYSFNMNLELLSGFDFALQEKSKLTNANESALATGGMLALKYKFKSPVSLLLRGDYYSDSDGILSEINTNENGVLTGFEGYGLTAGFEYRPLSVGYLRAEMRYLKMTNGVKQFDNSTKDSRVSGILTIGADF